MRLLLKTVAAFCMLIGVVALIIQATGVAWLAAEGTFTWQSTTLLAVALAWCYGSWRFYKRCAKPQNL